MSSPIDSPSALSLQLLFRPVASDDVKHLLTRLLEKNPSNRIRIPEIRVRAFDVPYQFSSIEFLL